MGSFAYALNFNRVNLVLDRNPLTAPETINIYNGENKLSVLSYNSVDKLLELVLDDDLDIKSLSFLTYENNTYDINYFQLYQCDDFNNRFFTSEDLGLFYSPVGSLFKLWTPVATFVNLLLYKNGDSDIAEVPIRYKMDEFNGVFSLTINEDLKGFFYAYEVTTFGKTGIAVDPYAKALGLNGLRGAIISMEETNPIGWDKDVFQPLKSYTDAIIYETSIRDISMNSTSGIQNKGKFLGLAEKNTKSPKNVLTGLSHIIEMGITHVQLMPFFDISYTSINEKDSIKYNWGYDPQNYNAPEGSYSTSPQAPKCRIKELKEMVLAFHNGKISINMDVVYNHVALYNDNNFETIFPGYYLRRRADGTFSNGSGCGNDTASEQKMMSKFIIDSVMFWATEYHLDGFRFDLMGLHDISTMNEVKSNLDTLGRDIMVYGEGWDLDTSLPTPMRAIKSNSKKTLGVGYFNDIIRDVVKGHVFDLSERGFANGKERLEEDMKFVILGTNGLLASPEQSINYISCHDNSTLWDKFENSNKDDSVTDRIKMVKLANAIIFTSQGVPFLHSGEEFLRTKYGEHNSYKSSDVINALNWDLKYRNQDVVNYHKGLIAIRKCHPAFRMTNYNDIMNNIEFIPNLPANVVAFIIRNNANGDFWSNILVVYNANKKSTWITIPNRQWILVADDLTAGLQPIKYIDSPRIDVSGISMFMAYSL